MTGPKGLNGSGDHSNISSLEEARKRAARKAKEANRAAARASGGMSLRDWIIGGIFMAMALGMIWTWLLPLARTTGLTR